MKVAILGFAREGQAALDYWNHSGNEITICDQNEKLQVPDGVQARLGKDYLNNLDEYEVIVRSYGISPKQIQDANPDNPDINQKVTTSLNEFLKVSPTRNIIGVTGSKGKGTTSTLIAKMLELAGKRVHLGGNMGIPPLLLLQNGITADDWVVFELSSFQLVDAKRSPHIAVCLLITDEHVDYHGTQQAYMDAKKQLFRWQSTDDIAIYYGANEDSEVIASVSPGKKIPYMTAPGAEVADENQIMIEGLEICKISEVKLLGKHNWQNICAAVTAVWQIIPDQHALREAIMNFDSLPNRLEPVREVDGVTFYNDSFSSNPGSVKAALEAVPGTKVLIVGGYEKKLDWAEFGQVIPPHADSLRKVLIIGEIGDIIAKVLQQQGITNFEVLKNVNMTDIVRKAKSEAQAGDAVLFTPGSSSFDMFKDFEDRGNQFREAVKAL